MPQSVPPLSPMPISSTAGPSPALVAEAGALQRAAQGGEPRQPLRGVHVGLVCGDDTVDAAVQFKAAAVALGAQVTLLDPARTLEGDAALEEVARLLGRLYDAVACLDLPEDLARRLAQCAAVPVLEVRTALAPAAGGGIAADQRPWAAQAALLAALR